MLTSATTDLIHTVLDGEASAAQAQAFRNGFFDQTAQLWSEAGTLLCTTHQLVYFKG